MNLESIVKFVTGIVRLRGATDGTAIGNITDYLKVTESGATGVAYINRSDVSTTVSASGNSSTFDSAGFGMISMDLNITAISGANAAIVIKIQGSEDGTDWFDMSGFRKFTATGGVRIGGLRIASRYYRFNWTVSGTTPSITFNIDVTLKNYLPIRNIIQPYYSDLDMTAVNNVSTVFTSANSRSISVQTTRAADGGNNGQWFVQASNDGVNYVQLTGNITQGPNTMLLTDLSSYGVYYYYQFVVKAATNAGTRVLDITWSAHQ